MGFCAHTCYPMQTEGVLLLLGQHPVGRSEVQQGEAKFLLTCPSVIRHLHSLPHPNFS